MRKIKRLPVTRVYLAGPYSSGDVITILQNIRQGIAAAAKILRYGYAPFCPWLDYQFSFFENISKEDYYRFSMEWLRVSDILVLLPGWEKSKGTLAEKAEAEKLNIQIYTLEMFLHEHALASSSVPVSPISIKPPRKK